MKVIFLKDVPKVGNRYDVKEFSDGYANNVLINKGLAIRATPAELAKIDEMRAKNNKIKEMEKEEFNLQIKKAKDVAITLSAKANEKGHLFAGVHKLEIIPAIFKQTRLQINEENIILDKPIKEIGSHEIEVRAGNKSAKFTLDIKVKI